MLSVPAIFDEHVFLFDDVFSPFLSGAPITYVLAYLIFGIPIALSDLTFELIAAPIDHVEIIFGEFTRSLILPLTSLQFPST